MRTVLCRGSYALMLVAWLVVTAWATVSLPEHAATHFGADGEPDGWMSPLGNALASLGLGLVLVALPGLMWLLTRGDLRLVNFQSEKARAYWLRPEHRDQLRRVLVDSMLLFAAMTGVLLVVAQVATVAANRRTPPRLGVEMWVALVLYLLGTAVWLAYLLRLLKVPEEPPRPDPPFLGSRVRRA